MSQLERARPALGLDPVPIAEMGAPVVPVWPVVSALPFLSPKIEGGTMPPPRYTLGFVNQTEIIESPAEAPLVICAHTSRSAVKG